MISYVPNYEVGNKPYICKVFTASSGEEFHTAINFSNETERAELPEEIILGHLDNILQYIENRSQSLEYIKLDEQVNMEPWPIKGWTDLQWANDELTVWWQYIYYKEEAPESSPIHVGINTEEHSHDDSDHTHDPETGEEVPNA
jgi:hypothetical protein